MSSARSLVCLMVASVTLTAAMTLTEHQDPLHDPHYFHHLREYNGTYHSRFENIDLDLILASRRLVHNYVACLTDIKPCTAEGDELKRILPDALQTKCAKCSQRQKEGAKKVITTLQVRYPDQWRTLRKKWDLELLKDAL